MVGKQQVTTVKINGSTAQALLDTGSFQTLIHPSLLWENRQIGGPCLCISCVHGDRHAYPTAEVYFEVGGQISLLSVGVVNSLAHQLILGQDIPILLDLVHLCQPVNVVTRSQGKVQVPAADEVIVGGQGEPETRMVEQVDQVPEKVGQESLSELPFFRAELSVNCPTNVRKSTRQRRQEKVAGTARKVPARSPEPEGNKSIDLPGDIEKLQQQDETLQGVMKIAEPESCTTEESPGEGYLFS